MYRLFCLKNVKTEESNEDESEHESNEEASEDESDSEVDDEDMPEKPRAMPWWAHFIFYIAILAMQVLIFAKLPGDRISGINFFLFFNHFFKI